MLTHAHSEKTHLSILRRPGSFMHIAALLTAVDDELGLIIKPCDNNKGDRVNGMCRTTNSARCQFGHGCNTDPPISTGELQKVLQEGV